MGEMKLDTLQFYVPVLVAVVVFLNYFKVVDRCMHCIGFSDDLFTHDQQRNIWGDAEDGKLLLADARARLERAGGSDPTSLREVRSPPRAAPPNVSVSEDRQRLINSEPGTGGTSSRLNHPLYEKYRQGRVDRGTPVSSAPRKEESSSTRGMFDSLW